MEKRESLALTLDSLPVLLTMPCAQCKKRKHAIVLGMCKRPHIMCINCGSNTHLEKAIAEVISLMLPENN